MKRNSILFTLCCLFSAIVFADEVKKDSVKYWNIKNSIILNSEQATLSNWSAGGYSSFAFSSLSNPF